MVTLSDFKGLLFNTLVKVVMVGLVSDAVERAREREAIGRVGKGMASLKGKLGKGKRIVRTGNLVIYKTHLFPEK